MGGGRRARGHRPLREAAVRAGPAPHPGGCGSPGRSLGLAPAVGSQRRGHDRRSPRRVRASRAASDPVPRHPGGHRGASALDLAERVQPVGAAGRVQGPGRSVGRHRYRLAPGRDRGRTAPGCDGGHGWRSCSASAPSWCSPSTSSPPASTSAISTRPSPSSRRSPRPAVPSSSRTSRSPPASPGRCCTRCSTPPRSTSRDPWAGWIQSDAGVWVIGVVLIASAVAWAWMLVVRRPRLPRRRPRGRGA